VRSAPNRVVAHWMACACPALVAEIVFWASLRPPLSMATSVWVRLCASMPMTVIARAPSMPVTESQVRSGGSPDAGSHPFSQSEDGTKGASQAPGENHRHDPPAQGRRRVAIPTALSRHYDTQPSHAGGPNTEKVDETFPTITPHDLRHTAASLAISSGANVKAVQRMLGHAKASMTLDVYADLFDDDLDVVASRLDDAIIKTNTTSKPASMQNAAD